MTTASTPAGSRQYWAFISYSHADDAWSRWLHRSLENYRVPRRLVGRPHQFGTVPKHLRPIFRDRDDLVSRSELRGAIHEALAASRDLIVICSPSAAASPYVNEEVERFKSFHHGDRIRCLIVDGEPSPGKFDCFPAALRSNSGAAGDAAPVEPLAADVRRGKDGKNQALLKILAGILDVPYDELRRREQRRHRERRTIAALGIAALLALMFVGLSDAGLNLPGAESARVRLDRAGVSLFRRVAGQSEIAETSARMRNELIVMMRDRHRDIGLYSWGPKKENEAEAWSSAQVLAALLRTPETTPSEWPSLRLTVDRLFSEPYFVQAQGRPQGWLTRVGRPLNGNVVLWMVAALAQAAGRKDVVPEADRPWVASHYASAVLAAARLSPLDDGGWNMFASQDDPAIHNFYTSALALQALLIAHSAGLAWTDGEAPLGRLSMTGRWLVEGFDGATEHPGWRREPQDKDVTLDGLTLQIYALLLQAEALGAVELPADLLTHMTRHLESLVERDRGFQAASAEFNVLMKGVEESEGINLLWYPWAIRAADLWLRRSDRVGAAPEDVRRVRRSLGHLIVTHGDAFVHAEVNENTFRAAELLWNLAPIAPALRR